MTLTPAAAQTNQLLIENWNADTCEFTDTVSLVLEQPTMLSRVDTWYRWNPQESAVAYSLLGNGNVIAQGAFARSDCDPYQQAWCIGRDTVDLSLPPGRYDFKVARPNVCRNARSGGYGFVRAYIR